LDNEAGATESIAFAQKIFEKFAVGSFYFGLQLSFRQEKEVFAIFDFLKTFPWCVGWIGRFQDLRIRQKKKTTECMCRSMRFTARIS
jgi:hypothetical protein